MSVDPILLFHIFGALWFFGLGSVVGSFVNVAVHRIPWEKSLLWPGSHCPKCWNAIRPRDNVPILGWLMLGGKCRNCRARISARYPLVELLVGVLFALIYLMDVAWGSPRLLDGGSLWRMLYHDVLVCFLVIATFIDYDTYTLPDAVTVPGMLLGIALGALMPGVRLPPSDSVGVWDGLLTGLAGWAVGGGIVWVVRIVAGTVLRREAMGFGDVTLMAMIGSFVGWQASVLTFFLAPFFGLGHTLVRLVRMGLKRVTGRAITVADREIPYGPYLSLAALALVLAWPAVWDQWAKGLFATLAELFRWGAGGGLD